MIQMQRHLERTPAKTSAASRGVCMRCGEATQRIVIVGCVCERCAIEVDFDSAEKRLTKAAQWLEREGVDWKKEMREMAGIAD